MTRASLAALILAAGGAAAQGQALGESTVTATITQRFEFDDNYRLREDPDPAAFSDTRFGLDYLRETSTQRLSLFGNLGLFSWAIAFASVGLVVAIMLLELIVVFVQAYVFTLITAVLIGVMQHEH